MKSTTQDRLTDCRAVRDHQDLRIVMDDYVVGMLEISTDLYGDYREHYVERLHDMQNGDRRAALAVQRFNAAEALYAANIATRDARLGPWIKPKCNLFRARLRGACIGAAVGLMTSMVIALLFN